jgi:enoyl-CoA hydratase/carnithine racemase
MSLVEYSSARRGVVLITLNRPERLNAFSIEMLRELRDALHEFDLDKDASVAVVRGHGRAFCSGADVRELGAMKSRGDVELLREMQSISHLLFSSSNWKPVVAVVHGYVMGMALEFVFQTDYVVAQISTKFQVAETNVGVGSGLIWPILAHRSNATFASDVCMSGRFFDAAEARRNCLVSATGEDNSESLSLALSKAEQLAKLPRESVRYNVQVARHYAEHYVGSALSFSEANFHLAPDVSRLEVASQAHADDGR